MSEDHGPPAPISASGLQYFCFLAEMGITKHLGSHNVSLELIDLCRITSSTYVLDVGCGVGATPSFLAKAIGCRVAGVDIMPKMIERTRARTESEGVAALVELRVADARALPFEDNTFDAVICESVLVFLDDKQRAVDEFVRVTKPGGYVGVTEVTLLKPTDDREFLSYMAKVGGVRGEMLSEAEWVRHLHDAGLQDIVARAHHMDIREEAKARLRRYRGRDMVAALARLPRMWFANPDDRAFLRETFGGVKHVRKETFDHLGYGAYAGRKPPAVQEK